MDWMNLQSVDKLFYLDLCCIRERDHKSQHQKCISQWDLLYFGWWDWKACQIDHNRNKQGIYHSDFYRHQGICNRKRKNIKPVSGQTGNEGAHPWRHCQNSWWGWILPGICHKSSLTKLQYGQKQRILINLFEKIAIL